MVLVAGVGAARSLSCEAAAAAALSAAALSAARRASSAPSCVVSGAGRTAAAAAARRFFSTSRPTAAPTTAAIDLRPWPGVRAAVLAASFASVAASNTTPRPASCSASSSFSLLAAATARDTALTNFAELRRGSGRRPALGSRATPRAPPPQQLLLPSARASHARARRLRRRLHLLRITARLEHQVRRRLRRGLDRGFGGGGSFGFGGLVPSKVGSGERHRRHVVDRRRRAAASPAPLPHRRRRARRLEAVANGGPRAVGAGGGGSVGGDPGSASSSAVIRIEVRTTGRAVAGRAVAGRSKWPTTKGCGRGAPRALTGRDAWRRRSAAKSTGGGGVGPTHARALCGRVVRGVRGDRAATSAVPGRRGDGGCGSKYSPDARSGRHTSGRAVRGRDTL